MVVPVPIDVPLPHAPEYHVHVAPGDKVPFTDRLTLLPEQIGEVPLADVGAFGGEIIFTVVFTQFERQLPFSALT